MNHQYRKRPVIVEAFQYFNGIDGEKATIPQWILAAIEDGTIYADGSATYIKTPEGDHFVSEGDWIIQGVKGELYPCKPDIFEKTYDPIAEDREG